MIPTQTLDEFLDEQGYSGQIQEALSDYLSDLGYTGQLNEAIYKWLRATGYEGTLADMILDWVAGFVPTPVEEWLATSGNGSITITKMPEVLPLNAVGGEESITIGNV